LNVAFHEPSTFQVLAVLLLALWWAHPTSATAHLLASKSILNEHVAEGKDLTVMYSIYNVGSSPAQSIVLDDSSFHPEDFTLVQGLLSASWDRIPHNTNVTHTVILRPLSFGLYNISWARISYTSSDNGQEMVGCWLGCSQDDMHFTTSES